MNRKRVELARMWARSLLAIAGAAISVPVFLFIAAPRFTGGMGGNRTDAAFLLSDLPIVIGVGGLIFGLAWMWRMYKAPTKYTDSALWRLP